MVVVALLLSVNGSARKGVGIKWMTETEMVSENTQHCIEYGIYNPWDEDVRVYLSVSGELTGVITSEHSDPKLVPGDTSHTEAVPVNLCFTVSKVYKDNCMLGPFMCEQTCDVDEVSYNGKIVAVEAPHGDIATGSATGLGVSVPLTLKVRCQSFGTDWTFIYVVVIVIILVLIGLVLRKRKK